METRFLQAEIRQEKNRISGYAAVFNSPAQIPDVSGRSFTEIVRPGAFSRALKEAKDVLVLYNHDHGKLLGRTQSGTARLQEDSRGLWFEVQLVAEGNPTHQEIRSLVERGDISGCSFAFMPNGKEGERWGKGPTRELLDLDLYEVSVVASPAFAATSCNLRSLDQAVHQANGILTLKLLKAQLAV